MNLTNKELLDAGVHFGHLKKKWNPKMSPYIFMERKGIHIIDLNKTMSKLEEAGAALRQVARSGKKILFVATKKQAKELVKKNAEKCNMPFVTERWLGGMLTNFATIRKSVKRMQSIDKMVAEANITKKERLMLEREKTKMERVIGGIAGLNRTPAAIFIVDIAYEHIALAESRKLGIRTFAMVDTNSDPTKVDFPIPANDDASKSIELICDYITDCVIQGLEDRKTDKTESASAVGKDVEAGDEGGEKKDLGTGRRMRSRRKKADEETAAAATETPAAKETPAADAKAEDKSE